MVKPKRRKKEQGKPDDASQEQNSSVPPIHKECPEVAGEQIAPRNPQAEPAQNNDILREAKRLNKLTIYLIVVNLILAFATFLLYLQAVNQTTSAERASEFQQEFTKKDVRAYVGFRIEDFAFTRANGLTCNIKVFNVGKSPARFVYNITGFFADSVERGVDSVFNVLSGIVERRAQYGSTLLTSTGGDPNALLSFPIQLRNKSLTIKDSLFYYAAMMLDRFLIVGEVKYFDVFNERHKTIYCQHVNIFTGISRPYRKYNDAD
jgi:hypothetical protein